MNAEELLTIFQPIANREPGHVHGSFLTAFAVAIVRADPQNLALLTPAALEMVRRYRLQRYTISADGKSITCNTCSSTSYHPKDVEQRFCSRCKVFLDDPPPSMREVGREIKSNLETRMEGEQNS